MIAKAPFLSLLASITSVQALGINCEGSSTCDVAKGSASQVQHVVCEIAGLNPDRYYSAGQQIGCDYNFCAFYQKTGGGTAGRACSLLGDLVNHGCRACGSVPTQAGNDVNNGELTVNYVSDVHPEPPY